MDPPPPPESPHPNPLPAIPGEGTRAYGFSKSQRLHGRGTFKAILDRGTRKWLGPIGMCVASCEAPTSRLGISIGRPVGNAVKRNRIKRKLRETFRLMQHDWPRPFDVVLLVKKHDPMTLAEYQRTLSHLMMRCLKPRETPPASKPMPADGPTIPPAASPITPPPSPQANPPVDPSPSAG